ncbi:hypothetical protein LCGC14_0181510 [marine sediment metagenome]|uniref:Prepilin-type N-terminal cleavage/methylation domain-containing protein n=1 Tax=marine sediment metagenome TaxID=412755 RepID=A0A0F9XS48_9ZZZZ|nr:prepilin-type N-terminal cleavage/methylation domain-containing protein [Phycisphaerae bacterium]HDZ44407.1 prepilin-type N-terminal cleavage/methylation domain-containing protein [Phycisphaerae bacterium]
MRQPTRQFIRRRRGFSLAELMIAIGILLVGLVMAASLFPAAMEINRRSVRDILGAIICENGIALTKARFASGAASNPENAAGRLTVLADAAHVDYFNSYMCRFPQGDTSSPFGFVLVYRYIDVDDDPETKEGHQLGAVAYRRRAPVSAGKLVRVIGTVATVAGASIRIGPVSSDAFRIDSPVFDRATGEFVFVRQIFQSEGYANTAVVNRKIKFTPDEGTTSAYLYVVKEEDEGRYSPALMAMVTRVPLDWR